MNEPLFPQLEKKTFKTHLFKKDKKKNPECVNTTTSTSSSCPNKHHLGQTRSNIIQGNDCPLFSELSRLQRLKRIFAPAPSSLMSSASTKLLTSHFSYFCTQAGGLAGVHGRTRVQMSAMIISAERANLLMKKN